VLHIHLPEKNPDGTVVDYFERNKGAYHQIKVAYDRKTDIIKKENMQDK
jgi:stalled ribosome rescue protein Dom34